MNVRDALEDDAPRLATLTGMPEGVVGELVHDRTTRVATEGTGDELDGVVSFDARPEAVYVTQLAGSTEAVSRLLDEPMNFARREGMAVEVLLDEGESALKNVVCDAGFEHAGAGPEFDGHPTSTFRIEP